MLPISFIDWGQMASPYWVYREYCDRKRLLFGRKDCNTVLFIIAQYACFLNSGEGGTVQFRQKIFISAGGDGRLYRSSRGKTEGGTRELI